MVFSLVTQRPSPHTASIINDGEDGDHRAGYMYYVVLACGDFGPVLSAVSLLRVEEISKGMKILVS